jgi:hypothetical protein
VISLGDDEFLEEHEVAAFLGKRIQSLRSDASRRKGPPRVVIGRRVLYRKESFVAWVLAHERSHDGVGALTKRART